MDYTYEYFCKSAEYVREKIGFTPEIGIVLGSALGPFAQHVEDPVVIPYEEIPNFLRSTVATHAGKLICGTIAGKKVVCMSGRFHSYEGYDFDQLTAPVRLFKLLGCRAVILTNAAGGVNENFKPGDIMIINDQMMFCGFSPLRGKNIPEFGPRFFDVQEMYTPALRELALPVFQKALEKGLTRNEAGVLTLLHLIAQVEDTNLYHRGGESGAAFAKDYARRLLWQNRLPKEEELLAMDREFIKRNLSPGGCADLLALTYFVSSLSKGMV